MAKPIGISRRGRTYLHQEGVKVESSEQAQQRNGTKSKATRSIGYSNKGLVSRDTYSLTN
jgi:hypothetical protein